MRRIAFVFLSILFLSSPAIADIDLNEIREETVELLDELKTYKADDVLKEIRHSIKKFNEVSEKVLSAPPGQEDLYVDDLISFYETAAADFGDIDSQRDKILQETRERRGELGHMIRDAELEINSLEREIRAINSRPISTDEFKRDVEKQQRASLTALYQQQIEALNIWISKYNHITSNAGTIETAIDRLLYVVSLSIPIYEQTANTLRMNRDLKRAMSIFESQEEIQILTNQVIDSWTQTEILISRALDDLQGVGEALP